MNKLGLLGKDISYSFSRTYFKKKFENENITNTTYENFDIKSIDLFPSIIKNTSDLKGLNVTIPYKEVVMPYLDKVNKKAKAIGAVNTIKVTKKGKLVGYNTDCYGFKKSIEPFLKPHHKSALILGTGGASKAIAYTLKKLGITYQYVSRKQSEGIGFTYDLLTEDAIKQHQIIINCTPLGTFPNVDDCPDIPYQAISNQHILFDLIYNPEETKFLKSGKSNGAITINGLNMLKLQAEKAWSIWNL
ncbi:shikimate dehydrogenase family protein [Flavivirga eckloniae]|uniref:Shikimate dehydrogenase n=1 Tax=Flavivirga eckloniae TaxID=1803846 RepID=A0A2K9PMJ1_9FLAO|nr:shikimate dehydrogenase [Flavivirga eckloniae]AUP78058.1 shikimate dehydrogenase [Flavivirga eckloniae]